MFGPKDSYIENISAGQRIPASRRKGVFCGALGRTSGFESDETCEVRWSEHGRVPVVNKHAEEVLNAVRPKW